MNKLIFCPMLFVLLVFVFFTRLLKAAKYGHIRLHLVSLQAWFFDIYLQLLCGTWIFHRASRCTIVRLCDNGNMHDANLYCHIPKKNKKKTLRQRATVIFSYFWLMRWLCLVFVYNTQRICLCALPITKQNNWLILKTTSRLINN